jgi:hypothetical protein
MKSSTLQEIYQAGIKEGGRTYGIKTASWD